MLFSIIFFYKFNKVPGNKPLKGNENDTANPQSESEGFSLCAMYPWIL